MKPNSNRYKILSCLSPGKGNVPFSLSGPELRTGSGLEPLKFRAEIRALLNLRWVGVSESKYGYQITEAGKAALEKSKEKKN